MGKSTNITVTKGKSALSKITKEEVYSVTQLAVMDKVTKIVESRTPYLKYHTKLVKKSNVEYFRETISYNHTYYFNDNMMKLTEASPLSVLDFKIVDNKMDITLNNYLSILVDAETDVNEIFMEWVDAIDNDIVSLNAHIVLDVENEDNITNDSMDNVINQINKNMMLFEDFLADRLNINFYENNS